MPGEVAFFLDFYIVGAWVKAESVVCGSGKVIVNEDLGAFGLAFCDKYSGFGDFGHFLFEVDTVAFPIKNYKNCGYDEKE